MSLIRRGTVVATFLLLILTVLNTKATTTVFFDVQAVFTTQPPDNTNRVVRLQALSPFPGSFFYRTSDISGQFYVSNCLATVYAGQMLAPPNSVSFSFNVTSTNLGVVNAQSITSIPANGASTFPAGQTAWSAQASDLRYQFSSNAASLQFYPLGSNPSNYVLQANLLLTNNALTNLVFNTSNGLAAAIGSAGISAVTATNIASNQVYGATNTIGVSSGLSAMVSTNRFDVSGAATAATNAVGISSGLAAYINTNRFITTNYTSVWTNNGLYMTNASGWTFIGSNGLFIDSNSVLRTAFVVTTNRDWYLMSNGVVMASNNVASGNFTSLGRITGGSFQSAGSAVFGSVTSAGAGLFNVLTYHGDGDYGDTNSDGGWAMAYGNIDQWRDTTNADDHTRIWTNSTTGAWMALDTNNVFTVGGLPLGSLVTNIMAASISTNGSSANQVLTSIGGHTVWTNGALALGGITNATGTNFPNGVLVNQYLFYPTNDPSIASNALRSAITATSNQLQTFKADTNSPTIYTPTILGGAYTNRYLANGAFLRSNNAAPFD